MSDTATAEQARDAGIAEQVAAHPAAIERGIAVIARWARQGAPFSANDIRGELDAAEVPRRLRGGLIRVAKARGLIRAIPGRQVRSSDIATHSKPVDVYVGAHVAQAPTETVRVPVTRGRSGKFARPAPRPDPTDTLFEVTP